MPCVNLDAGVLQLDDDDLGLLDLSCEEGFVVASFDIGWPAERAVVSPRALADGIIDQTRFLGSRAITVSVRLDNRVATTQAILDRLSPYLSPRRRPTLSWSLAGSPTDIRALTVRGVDLPVPVTGPRFLTVVASFVSTETFARGVEQNCETIVPSGEGEVGREYDLEFDRVYPFSLPSGSFVITNAGNAPANWTGTIFGPITNPVVTVNGVPVELTIDLLAGQTLVINTERRTILFDGDPDDSRYNVANYTQWQWDDLVLEPGDNLFRLTGDPSGTGAALTVCWFDRWMV